LNAGFRARATGRFLCAPKESATKKGHPEGLSGHPYSMADRIPCASQHFVGISTNPLRRLARQDLLRLRLANPAQQGGSLDLKMPAMLGCA